MATMVESPARGGTILVVEDEYYIRRLLAEGLSAEGFRVSTVASAREALDSIGHVQPDLVLLDLMLPESSGLDLADEIHQQSSADIVAMSASHSLLSQAREMESVTGTVAKPFEWDELIGNLKDLVNGHSKWVS